MEVFNKYTSIQNYKAAEKDFLKNLGRGSLDKPTVKLKGTVKVHGTNAGINIKKNSVTAQSRNRSISIDDDNAGFASFVEENKDKFASLSGNICEDETLTIFGEWCGGNIQKCVGVTGMPKSFIVFGVQIFNDNEEGFIDCDIDHVINDLKNDIDNLYSILDFKTFEYTLDMNSQESIDWISELTLTVEKECPVAKVLNPDGNLVGEGVVWEGVFNNCVLRFKHKGEKHRRGSGSKKLKVSNNFTDEQMQAIAIFSSIAMTKDRLLQGKEYISEMFGEAENPKHTGDFIKWFMKDILKECAIEIESLEKDHGVTFKMVQGDIAKTARNFYLNG